MRHGELTWTCALLQETNTQPWGNLQLAVQESLELAEAVDIRELPGLHPLWTKHDLNIQGDANHFVNTLWNHCQTRAFHYRFAEIQAGGYLKDHIQQPILVDFPDDWPENSSLQDLYNGWANTGLGQYLLDDKPVHLEHLTPQLASQVTQIWAVRIDTFRTTQQVIRSLPPPEEPDYDPPLHPSPEKRPRLEQEHCQLHFANITTFGKQFLDWYWARQSEVHIFVETHLDPQRHQELPLEHQHKSTRKELATQVASSSLQTSGLTPLESYTHQGCGYQASECTILIAGVYLKTGEGIQSDTNATILAKLLALVESTKHPYILLGDWQNSPDGFTSAVLPSKFHFDIKAPDHSILTGNVIDYALMHNTLATTTALTTDWAVPWRPHALLTLHLNIEAATKEYRQIQHCPPLPATPDIDFRPWTSYQSQAFETELYGIPPNDQAQKWADWISCTEQYPLQEHPWAPQGRGASLKVSIKPLVSTKRTTTWKKGKPAFWEQLSVRFQSALKQPPTAQTGAVRGYMQALQDAPKHWVGPPTWGQLFDTSHHWHRYRDTHAAELVLHTIAHQLREAQQAANDEAHLQYKDWLKQGETKGLRGLFRSLKSSELAWERPYRNLPPDERMTQRLHDWGKLWQIRQTDQPHERPSLQTPARHQAQQLEPITIGQLASVLKHLPDKACGPDAVSAQLLRTAPPLHCSRFLSCSKTWRHRHNCQHNNRCTWSSCCPRTAPRSGPSPSHPYCTVCGADSGSPSSTSGRSSWPTTMQHDRARPGAQVLQVALERLLRQEVHKANGCHGVTCLMDMSTFYDTINLTRLQQEALQLHYPPLMLELAMQLYTGPKAIVAEQEMTPFFTVQNGVPAGCPQAPLLAKAVLAPALQPWKLQHPEVHLSSWVDDVGFDTAGRSPKAVAQKAVQAYRDMCSKLEELGLKVNPQKTAFIATDRSTDKALRELLQPDDPPVETVMRDLGVDHQGARRRRIPVMKQRLAKAHKRKVKLRTLRIPTLKIRLRLHRGGVQPAAQPWPSISGTKCLGSASGTNPRSMKPCRQNGWKGSLARMKNHCGPLAGFP